MTKWKTPLIIFSRRNFTGSKNPAIFAASKNDLSQKEIDMPLFGYSTQDLARAREEGVRAAYAAALQRLLDTLPPEASVGEAESSRSLWTFESLVQTVASRYRGLLKDVAQLRAEVEHGNWLRDVNEQVYQQIQAEARQQQQRADKASGEVNQLKQRLEAEQRARQSEIEQRDKKVADLERLLARYHLTQVEDTPADDD